VVIFLWLCALTLLGLLIKIPMGGMNMLFDNTDFNYEIKFLNIPGSNFNEMPRADKFVSVEEGFLRGNMMKDEYDPYKNYTYFKLQPENDRERLLFQLMAYSFAINDLNLYLDLHPEDQNTFALFKKYVKEKNNLEDRYTEKYGPMTITNSQGDMFSWVKNPWPWDSIGGSKYV